MPQRELVFAAVFFALMLASLVVWLAIARRLIEQIPTVEYVPRLRVPWNIVDVLLLVFAWPVLELAALRLSVSGEELLNGAFSSAALAAVTAAHFLWVVLAVAFLKTRYRLHAAELGFDTSRIGQDIRWGALAFLAAAPLVYGIQIVVSQFWPPLEHPLAKLIVEQPSAGLVALATLSAIVVAPVSEEFLFRVVLQGWLERSMRRWRRLGRLGSRAVRFLPIVVSAAMFAAMHRGSDRVALFVLALFLGFLYRQTHRIFPALVLHACVNALAVLGLGLGVH